MDTTLIQELLRNDKCFRGVFPCDLLPTKISYPSAYGINTDSSNKPGEHWVAVFFTPMRKAEYFDSFGLPPLNSHILKFIQNNSLSFSYNNIMIQTPHPLSAVCGFYAILFIR